MLHYCKFSYYELADQVILSLKIIACDLGNRLFDGFCWLTLAIGCVYNRMAFHYSLSSCRMSPRRKSSLMTMY
jgi:hypothetical protein